MSHLSLAFKLAVLAAWEDMEWEERQARARRWFRSALACGRLLDPWGTWT